MSATSVQALLMVEAQGNKKTRKTYMQEMVVDRIGSRLQIQVARENVDTTFGPRYVVSKNGTSDDVG